MNRDILLGSTIVETTDNQFGCVGEKSGDPFLIRFVQRDSTTVSYTHLDVYKRQLTKRRKR